MLLHCSRRYVHITYDRLWWSSISLELLSHELLPSFPLSLDIQVAIQEYQPPPCVTTGELRMMHTRPCSENLVLEHVKQGLEANHFSIFQQSLAPIRTDS